MRLTGSKTFWSIRSSTPSKLFWDVFLTRQVILDCGLCLLRMDSSQLLFSSCLSLKYLSLNWVFSNLIQLNLLYLVSLYGQFSFLEHLLLFWHLMRSNASCILSDCIGWSSIPNFTRVRMLWSTILSHSTQLCKV